MTVCLVTVFRTVLNELIKQLQKDSYEVYCSGTELLIFWDQRNITTESNIDKVKTTYIPAIKKKKKNSDEEIKIDHVNLQFGDYIDELPIKTGDY